ncbi:MAG: VWA domain-containing protein [Archangium sp.]
MRSLLPVVCVCLAACSPEDLSGFQPLPGVSETSHTVTTVFEAGAAKLRVRRTLRNESANFETVSRTFQVPDEAVATSLRLGTNGQWLTPAALASVDEVDVRWSELISPGTAEPVPLAKLEWGDRHQVDGLDFELFGLAPGATIDIEYELELPSNYEAGEVWFSYPLEAVETGWLPPSFSGVELQQTEEGVDIRRAWATREAADVRWATFPVDTDRTLWRLEVDVAAELGTLPQRPNVVFVVDASISEGADGIASQLELIAPYLANVPDARVEVVLYRRFAERLFGRFVSAAEFTRELALIPPARLVPGNGSHLDQGAELAARTLTQESGLGRIVLFTDERVRRAFPHEATTAALTQLAPLDTITHVVRRTAAYGDTLTESRDDAAPLSNLASATGGIFVEVMGHPGDAVLATETMRALVRPVRIDSFEVDAKGFGAPSSTARLNDDGEETEWEDTVEGSLHVESEQHEGNSVRLSGIAPTPPQQLTVRGKIWAKSFERVVTVDEALAKRLPAFAVGNTSLRTELTDDELRTVAFVSGAVSPVTSFLAAPPNAQASYVGVERQYDLGGYGFGSIGCGGFGTSSRCGFGVRKMGPDLIAMLRTMLQPKVAACEAQFGDASAARLSLEATADEVVDVNVTGVPAPLAACLVEAGWALELNGDFEYDRTYDVALTK